MKTRWLYFVKSNVSGGGCISWVSGWLNGFFSLPFTSLWTIRFKSHLRPGACGCGLDFQFLFDCVSFPFGVFLPHLKLNNASLPPIHPVLVQLIVLLGVLYNIINILQCWLLFFEIGMEIIII